MRRNRERGGSSRPVGERVQGVEVQSALQRRTETADSQELFDD